MIEYIYDEIMKSYENGNILEELKIIKDEEFPIFKDEENGKIFYFNDNKKVEFINTGYIEIKPKEISECPYCKYENDVESNKSRDIIACSECDKMYMLDIPYVTTY
jgi:uncharacterized Zn-finger protein